MRRFVVHAILVGLGAGACQQRPPTPSPAPSAAPPAASVSVPTAAQSSAPPDAIPGPAASTISAQARIPCGKSTCPAATQICCGHVPNERGTCLDYAGDRTDIYAAGRACRAIDDQRYPLICDDSGDCPAGHTCCDELGGDPDYLVCTPLDADGWHSCNGFEVCTEDAACRARGTKCERGTCEPPRPDPAKVRVSCLGRTCTGDAPVCCGGVTGGQCVNDARQCPDQSPVIHCSGPGDCASHETCLFYPPTDHPGWYTTCSQWSGGGNLPIACHTDADCPTFGGTKLTCQPNADFPVVRTCAGP